MKKKWTLGVLSGLCVATCAVGFTACGGGDHTTHTYNKQVATEAYTAPEATATEKATYYYSCECGEKGTTTFEFGDYAVTYGALLDTTVDKIFSSDYVTMKYSVGMDMDGEMGGETESMTMNMDMGLYAKKTADGYDGIIKMVMKTPIAESELAEILVDSPVEDFIRVTEYYYIGGELTSRMGTNISIDYTTLDITATETVEEWTYGDVEEVGTIDEMLAGLMAMIPTDPENGSWSSYLEDAIDALFEDGEVTLDGIISLITDATAEFSTYLTEVVDETDGKYVVAETIDLADDINDVIGWMTENKDVAFGTVVMDLLRENGVTEKTDAEIIADLQDLLVDGQSVAAFADSVIAYVNSYIENEEEKLNLKSVVDEIQAAAGVTTQEVIDMLKEALGEDMGSMLVNAQAGQTIYDYFYGMLTAMPIDQIIASMDMEGMDSLADFAPFVNMIFDDGNAETREPCFSWFIPSDMLEMFASIDVAEFAFNIGMEAGADKVIKSMTFEGGFDVSLLTDDTVWDDEEQDYVFVEDMPVSYDVTESVSFTLEFTAPSDVQFVMPTPPVVE